MFHPVLSNTERDLATELKTDSWHRYMMYRQEERFLPFASEEERRTAIEKGRNYALTPYADVWASDADLVARVRRYLGENFHWHERLAQSGSDLEVVQMLQDMVRGGSIVVVPEKPITGGAGRSWPPSKPASTSFWGVEDYDKELDVPVMTRYRAQLLQRLAERPSWEKLTALEDETNQRFMHSAVLADPVGTLPVFAKAGWVSKYGLPDLRHWGEASVAGINSVADLGTTPLGDAQPFEYTANAAIADAMLLAGAEGTPGNNQAQNKQFKAVVRTLGLNPGQARQLHDEISKQRLGYHEILQRGQDMFGSGND
jgi:hypothetical protein